MTDLDLSDDCADDVEQVIVAWLTPLRRTAAVRRTNDELPFTLVTHITGSEKPAEYVADEVVSVHTLCSRADGPMAAADEAQLTHRRMLALRNLPLITLPDGRDVSVDYVSVEETPHREFYANEILRHVGRYRVGLSYVDQPVDSGS